MRRLVIAGLVAGAVLLLWPPANAVVEMRTSVNGSGGGRVSSAAYGHSCTVGQAAVGVVTSAAYIHDIGFWYQPHQASSGVPDPQAGTPAEFALGYGSSNPLGAVGAIAYAVPVPGHVTLRLYDATGRVVRTLVDGDAKPGQYQADLAVAGLGGGIYFCRMEADGFSATRKLVLIR